MPFLDHLEELRWRLIWCLGALLAGCAVGLAVLLAYHEPVLLWLQGPILPYLHGRRLTNTHPGAGMSILVSVAFVVGILIALPVIVQQLWAFLSPALRRSEKRTIVPVAIGAVFLYVCGAALAWFLVLPMTLRFLTGIGESAFDQLISAREYFGFALTLVLLTGAVFELPMVILVLSVLGLAHPRYLRRWRRHAAVGAFVAAALVVPGDVGISVIVLAMLLYLLYEASIGLSQLVVWRRERRAAALETMEASGA